MNQTTTPTTPARPRLETIKRFFDGLNSPSPLGWIVVAGLSYTSSALLIGNLIALALLIPAIYVGVFGLNTAVVALKRTVIDQTPSSEHRFWTRTTERLIRTPEQYWRLILVATVGQMAMAFPTLLDFVWGITAPGWVIVGCGATLMGALFAYAVTLWYNPLT